MADPRERVEKLIALALDPANEGSGEARNAALQACKLIRQHDLLAQATKAWVPPKPQDDISERLRQWANQWAARQPSPPPSSYEPSPPPDWARPYNAGASTAWREIKTKHDHNQCPICGRGIEQGDKVWYHKAHGIRCQGCSELLGYVNEQGRMK